MSAYGIKKQLRIPFDEAIRQVTESLKTEGFGILTDVDISGTIKTKLGKDMPRYRILGACNPALAFQALQVEPEVGLMMPCNVIVYDDAGSTVVTAVDPTGTMAAGGNPAVMEVARTVRAKLEKALERLTA